MLCDGGTLAGRRILGRKTVELMTANHMVTLPNNQGASRQKGFGLGVEVTTDLGQLSMPSSAGQFGWYGAATTYCQIDPKERIVAIALAQHFPFNEHNFFAQFQTGYYQALKQAGPVAGPSRQRRHPCRQFTGESVRITTDQIAGRDAGAPGSSANGFPESFTTAWQIAAARLRSRCEDYSAMGAIKVRLTLSAARLLLMALFLNVWKFASSSGLRNALPRVAVRW